VIISPHFHLPFLATEIMPYSRFEEGWNKVEEEAIEKIKDALDKDAASNSNGRPRRLFTCSEIIHMKTTVYNLCTNKHAEYSNCSAEVYRRYAWHAIFTSFYFLLLVSWAALSNESTLLM